MKIRGFTLIELLVVIAIIGLLSAIILASLNVAESKGRDAKRRSDIDAVGKALEFYANDNHATYPLTPTTDSTGLCGGTPSCVDDLTQLVSAGYISALPSDPTRKNTDWNYRYCSTGSDYVILIYLESTGSWCRPPAQNNGVSCPTWTTTYPSC